MKNKDEKMKLLEDINRNIQRLTFLKALEIANNTGKDFIEVMSTVDEYNGW